MLRQALAVDHLMMQLESHLQTTYVNPRYRPGEYSKPINIDSVVLYVLETEEGHLEVLVSPERSQVMQLQFHPNDLSDLCLTEPTGAAELFRLASSFSAFSAREVDALLNCALVEPVDAYGQTPLFYAVAADDSHAVRAFLERGSNPNHRANGGWTPLWMAVRDTSEPEVVLELLRAGASASATLEASGAYSNSILETIVVQALVNENLSRDEAMLALIAAYLIEVNPSREGTGPATVVTNSGAAPFIAPPTATPHSRVVVQDLELDMVGNLFARSQSLGKTEEFNFPISAKGEVRAITYSGIFELNRQQFAITAHYVQDVTFTGSTIPDEFMLEGFSESEFEDFIIFEVAEVHGGLLGKTIVAVGLPDAEFTAELADQMNIGTVANFLVSTQLPLATHRLGAGAEMLTFITAELDGIQIRLETTEVIEDVSSSGFRVRIKEETVIPGFVDHGYGVTESLSMRDSSDYAIHYSYADPLGYTLTGEQHAEVDIEITFEDFGDVTSQSRIDGFLTGSTTTLDWIGIEHEMQRGVVVRIVVRILDRL